MKFCTHKNVIKLIFFVITTSILHSFVFPYFFSAKADLINEIKNQIEEKNNKISNLENQAEKYKNAIYGLGAKEQSLNNEIELLNAEISRLKLKIKVTETQIEQTNLEIEELIIKIKNKESKIKKQKEILKHLIRKLNEYDRETPIEIFIKMNNFSDFFNQVDYVNTTGEKIKTALYDLKMAKKELVERKDRMKEKKVEMEELNKKLNFQKESMNSEKTAKETLLKETKGLEYKYQVLLSNVKSQKKMILGDINKLKRKQKAEIAKIAALAKKPSGNLASTNWYFSQNDPRWKDKTIGLSNSRIDNYGCAISSVAMVFKYYGIDINPAKLAKQPIYYYDLIVWPKQWRFLSLVKDTRHKPGGLSKSDWNLIDRKIKSGNPVIVFINAVGRNGGHYVVIHGKDSKGYIVHDPIMWNNQSGANIYLSTTRKYLESLYKTNTIIDQAIIYQ